MHFAFIPVGKRSEVELLFRDMEAQKHLLKMQKDGILKCIWQQGQLRQLPLGVYEYIFPKEDVDCVLHTLINEKNRYNISELIIKFIKKFYKLKNIPEYNKDKNYLWIKENVNIIPLGIREDGVQIEPENMPFAGFEHEAL
jgi:hypothetical protein